MTLMRVCGDLMRTCTACTLFNTPLQPPPPPRRWCARSLLGMLLVAAALVPHASLGRVVHHSPTARVPLRLRSGTTPPCEPSQLPPPSPPTYFATMITPTGNVGIRVNRSWAPLAADRFYELIQDRFFDENPFWRVVKEPVPWVAQWGVSGDPALNVRYCELPNEPALISNQPGTIAFGMDYGDEHKNTTCCRATEVYVNYGFNERLDPLEFAPFAVVERGLNHLYAVEGPGDGPDAVDYDRLVHEGNAYLAEYYPRINRTKRTTQEVLPSAASANTSFYTIVLCLFVGAAVGGGAVLAIGLYVRRYRGLRSQGDRRGLLGGSAGGGGGGGGDDEGSTPRGSGKGRGIGREGNVAVVMDRDYDPVEAPDDIYMS